MKILLVIVLSVAQYTFGQLDLCDKVNLDNFSKVEETNLVTGGASIEKGYKCTYLGVDYSFVLDDESRILKLYVRDSTYSFSGLKIGDSYSEMSPSLIKEEYLISGFGYAVELEDGWTALFHNRKIIDERQIFKDAEISTFYKECRKCVSCPLDSVPSDEK